MSGLTRLGVFTGRNDRRGTPGGNGVMALAGVEGSVRCPATVCLQTVRGGGDAGELLIGWDLVEKLGQHWGISDIAGGELGRPDFQCFLVDSPSRRMSHSPAGQRMWILRQTRRFVPPCLRAFHSASPSTLMPPRRFARTGGAYRLDVNQEGLRAWRATIGDVDLQGPLAAAGRAEVRHNPVQVDQP